MLELSVLWFTKLVRYGNFILYFPKNFALLKSFWSLKKGLGEEFSKTGNRAVFEIKVLSQDSLMNSYKPTIERLFLKVHVQVKGLNLLPEFKRSCGGKSTLLLKVQSD